MNLIDAPYLPIRRQDGTREFIAPWQLTEDHDNNPIIAIDSPRPDFNGALTELLIGLFQAGAAPRDEDDSRWEDWLEAPPPPGVLQKALAPLRESFIFDGDGPRFLQDLTLDISAENAIAGLLIDSPGDNTVKNNADHFIKRDSYGPMSMEAAVAALWTLQTYAPSGGQGHRTSLRGGGPLTTLVVLDPTGSELQPSLWRNVWLNVIDQTTLDSATGNPDKTSPADRFPWLAPTRTSEGKTGRDTYADEVNPLQMYFAMPRRIRLDFSNTRPGICSVYGAHSEQLISHYATKNLGINYSGNWEHPLSPHRKDKKSGESIPLHPQPGGISYRHWPGIVLGNEERTVTPALVVRRFLKRKLDAEQLRAWAFGYDMDNMKARGWCDAILPIYLIPDEHRDTFTIRVNNMIAGADKCSEYLEDAIKKAWFARLKDARGDTSFLNDALYQHTETLFYQRLHQLSDKLDSSDTQAIISEWYIDLKKAGNQLFDYWAASSPIEQGDPRRVAKAHNELQKRLNRNLPKVLKIGTTRKQEKTP